MKKIFEYVTNMFNGFCMAMADSVPGVSGGTVAFLLGFYDKFISSLDRLFRGKLEEKIEAFKYLIKIGIGWAVGFCLCATILSSLFTTKIYLMSSLFIGFIIFAIPVVIKEEKSNLKGKYKNIIFSLLAALVVIGISILTGKSLNIDIDNLNVWTVLYMFVTGAIAISAMVLPGISGSTLLLVFGLYIPIMGYVKRFLHFDLSVVPQLVIFGLGIVFGLVFFTGLIKKCLEVYRSQTIYAILGLMVGSIYSITLGPTTLDVPLEALNIHNFSIIFFIIGGLIIVCLELMKYYRDKKAK